MVKRRDLNAPPGRRIADAIKAARDEARSSKTGAHGVKDLGELGDTTWRDSATGDAYSMRVIPPILDETRDRLGDAQDEIDDAKQAITNERASREAALEEAQEQLGDLADRLDGVPSSGELEDLRDDVALAQGAADDAAEAAGAAAGAAGAADERALEALGVAQGMGKVIHAPEPPTGADRSAQNLWIDSDTGRAYVWDESAGDWVESESEGVQAAAAAAADAADAAAAAQGTADDAARAAADAADAAADAQATADQATTDARDAHNEAVAAAERVQAKIEAGDSLILNGSFENGHEGWRQALDREGFSRVVESPAARSGDHVLEMTPASANVYPETDYFPTTGGRVLRARGWFMYLGGDAESRMGLLYRARDRDGRILATTYFGGSTGWVYSNDAVEGEWIEVTGDAEMPEEAVEFTVAFHVTGPSSDVFHADGLQIVDVTEARAAQDRAEEAYGLAESRPSADEVELAITTSANGKNAITVSAAGPSGDGVVAGDTWWQVDDAGDIFGQWTWTGSDWAPSRVASEVIAALDVGKLTVTGESRFTEAVVDRLFADLFTAHRITAEQITIAALDGDGNLAPGSVGAITLQDGVVGADKIIADEVAAEVSDLVRARIENLEVTDGAEINEAVILKLASEMITAGVLRTAEAGQRVVIDGNGLVMWGLDAGGNEYELVRLGPSGENLLTIGDTTVAASGVSSPSGVFDELAVGGQDLSEILSSLPRGIVAWGQVTENSSFDSDPDLRARRAELQTTLEPGRLYRVAMNAHLLDTSAGSARVLEYLHYSFDQTPIPRGSSSGDYRAGAWLRHYLYGNSIYAVPGLEFLVNTGDWSGTSARHFWVMYSVKAESTNWPVRLIARHDYPVTLTVEDLGPSVPGNVKRWNDNNEGSAQDPGQPEQRYVKTYDATDFRCYNRDGSSAGTPDVVQGLYAGGPSNSRRRGGWLFPSMTGDLSGATIEKVEAYLHLEHSYYTAGATVNVATWGGAMRDNLDAFTTVQGWKRGVGRWITLPSSLHAGFRSGAISGVGVVPSNGFAEQFARFPADSARIRITYRK